MEKIYRLKHNVYVSGIGVVLFGIWSSIKAFITVVQDGRVALEEALKDNTIESDFLILYSITYYVIVIIIVLLVIQFHNFIGFNAIRYAKGNKYHKSYILFAMFLTFIELYEIPGYIRALKNIEDLDTTIVSIIVNITLIYILLDIIISSIRLKQIEKKREL